MRGGAIHLGAVGVLQAEYVAAKLDHRHLHPEANAKVGNAVLARVADGLNLPLDATLAKTSRHQNRVHPGKRARTVLLKVGRLDVMEMLTRGAAFSVITAMHQRLVEQRPCTESRHLWNAYLPTIAMSTRPSGFARALTT